MLDELLQSRESHVEGLRWKMAGGDSAARKGEEFGKRWRGVLRGICMRYIQPRGVMGFEADRESADVMKGP